MSADQSKPEQPVDADPSGDTPTSTTPAETGPAETTPAASNPAGDAQASDGDAQPKGGDAQGEAAVPAEAQPVGGPLSEEVVLEELKKVIDPELFVNIVDLGLIYVVTICDRSEDDRKDVKIEMTMTSPMCPAGPQLIGGCKHFLQARDDVVDVEVKVVMDPPWSPDRMTEEARDQLGIF